ncbi:MAG: Gfo/Idh/MocA family oxidoreductase [Nitratireductor sp.]
MQLRVAIAGLGYFSQFHLASWQKIPETCITGVFDADAARVAEIAQQADVPGFASLTDMLTALDPEILDIVTPPRPMPLSSRKQPDPD